VQTIAKSHSMGSFDEMIKKLIYLGVLSIVLISCETRETAKYDVYFWPSVNSKEILVGNVSGLSACQITARHYAAERNNGDTNYDWSYVCCLNRPSNSCAEKHR
jgi:hypothetical protein